MKNFALTTAIISALGVTACGGSSNPSDSVISADLQTLLKPTTYAVDSEELAAFNKINAFRLDMGLGCWQQNLLLDKAAQNHMTYSISNDPTFQNVTDIEVINATGFTGITPSQRAINAGYFVLINTATATNVRFAAVGELYSIGDGATVLDSMLNTIYRRSGVMAQSTREIGIAKETLGPDATPTTHWWFNHGRLDNGQSVASNYTAFYPKNQQVNVPLSMTPENPSVYSNQANFNFALQTSSPVSFMSAARTHLIVTTFTVTPSGSSTPLAGTIWTSTNDPNLLSSNSSKPPNSGGTSPHPVPTLSNYEAYWVGNAPFSPCTTYNAAFTGSAGINNSITQNWSFTTTGCRRPD